MNTTTVSVQQPRLDSQKIKQVFERLFSSYTGSLGVRLWDGQLISLGQDRPVATVVIHAAGLLRHLAWRPDLLRLAEAYFYEEVDVEGDLYALLMQKTHLQSLTLSARDRLSMLAAVMFRRNSASLTKDGNTSVRCSSPMPMPTRLSGGHSKALNRHAIAFHYDVSNEFYRLWLDDEMVYSCAYFTHPDESLEQAQRNKLDHICRKLRLTAGERLLDIGCGWGALICWAAQNYGVQAHGITLSREQFEYAQSKIHHLGLEKQVTVELRDYRDLPAHAIYDKVSSIGMFEHVGLKNLPVYFRAVDRVLKPDGLFLNHGITDNETGKRKTVGTEFIQRYVFPDGELDCVSNVQREMELNGFEISDVEALRPHYAMTLRHWVRRLEARRAEALSHVSEARYRVWRLYMAGCAVQFENGAIGVYQILASKRGGGLTALPLTRADIYQAKHPAPTASEIK